MKAKKPTLPPFHTRQFRLSVLVFLLMVSVALVWYFFFHTRGDSLFSHFFYVPVILSAIWWKRRGIFVAVFLALLLIIGHILAEHVVISTDDIFRGMMFIVISATVALMSERMTFSDEAYRRAHRALRVYSACNRTIVLANEEKSMLSDICDIIVDIGDYRLAWVGYKEEGTSKTIRPVAVAGQAGDYILDLNVTWDDSPRSMGPIGRAIRTEKPAVSYDIENDPLFEPWREHALTRGLLSAIAIPLIVEKTVIGALGIYAPEPDAFDSDEVRLLTELAGDISFGVETLRSRARRLTAEASVRLNQSRLEALLQLNRMSDLSIQEIKDYVLEESVRLTGSTIGYLAFTGDEGETLTVHSWSKNVMDSCAMDTRDKVFALHEVGLWGDALRQRRPVITNDYSAPDPRKKGLPRGHLPVTRHMSVPLLDESGSIVALAGVGNKRTDYDESDVTQLTLLVQAMWKYIQRRQAEEEIRKYRDRLEEMVRQRTGELQSANNRLRSEISEKERLYRNLEDKTRELDSFVHTASHDLKAPLVVLGGYTDRIVKKYGRLLDETGLKYLDLLRANVNRMEKLIMDLLELSRAGRVAGERVPVEIDRILDEIRSTVAPMLRERNIVLSIAGPMPRVLGDSGRINQVFQNLIINAIKFMGMRENALIDVGYIKEKHGQCTYYVRDNGIGIDPADQEIVFKEFHRLKQVETDGTGIGLAIVKKIVEHHEGRIWIESEPGEGSTFFIELPSVEEEGPDARENAG